MRVADADGHVVTLAHDVHEAVDQVELEAHLGVRLVEVREVGNQLVPGEGARHRDTDDAAGGLCVTSRFAFGLAELEERLARAGQVTEAGFGDLHAPRRALEESCAEAILQRPDPPADGRLRQPAGLARAGEAAAVQHLDGELRIRDATHNS